MSSMINNIRENLKQGGFSDEQISELENMLSNNQYLNNFVYGEEGYKLNVYCVNKSDNPNPEYINAGDSGFDLRSSEGEILKAGQWKLIGTGLYFQIPQGFELQIRPRSGLANKYGVTVLNSPGTVDSIYRGEIKVLLINHGQEDFEINYGDRIAQGVIVNIYDKSNISISMTDELNDTNRGNKGFGSSGVK